MKWKKGDFVYLCHHYPHLCIGKAEVIQAGEKRLKLERYAFNSSTFGYKSVFDQSDPRLCGTADEAYTHWLTMIHAEIESLENRARKLGQLLSQPMPETEYRVDTISETKS